MIVLLVDDDSLVRRSFEQLFQREPTLAALKAQVRHAADGQEALAMAAAEPPQLVVVDLLMPRLDGFGFCRAFRQTAGGATTPILVVSGVYRQAAQSEQLLAEIGGARFLAKPVAAADFAAAVRELLGPGAKPAIADPEFLTPPGTMIDTWAAMRGRTARPSADFAAGRDTRADPAAIADLARQLAPSAQGNLAEKHLGPLLLDLFEAAETGTLVIRRGRMRKEIFLLGGRPVGAESNLRQEALGTYLLERGIIDEARLQVLLAEGKRRQVKMGALLIEMGWLSEDEVLRHLEGQTRMRIVTSLRWSEGEWSFLPGEAASERRLTHPVDVDRVVFDGLQRSVAIAAVAAEWAKMGGRQVRLLPRLDRYRAAAEAVLGTDLLRTLAGAPTFAALLARPDSDAVIAGVETLIELGLAAVDESETPSASSTVIDPLSLSRLRDSATMDVPPEATPVTEFDADYSGMVNVQITAGGADVPESEQRRRAFLREYLQIHDRSYYEMLGVPSTAGEGAIHQAYEVAIMRLSAESMGDLATGHDAPKLDEMRMILARARVVLSDPMQRAAYDRRLDRPSGGTGAGAMDAELAFRAGLAALAAGNFSDASRRLDEAARAAPDQAAYHAYLGWARHRAGRDAAARAESRAALDTALSLDPDLIEANEFAGRIAIDEGRPDTAREYLERAVTLDPARLPALDALSELYVATGQGEARERLFRKVIHRLGNREPGLRQRLWRELGAIYQDVLGDPKSAQIAFRTAARLGPDDEVARRRSTEMAADDPESWRDAASAALQALRRRPTDVQQADALIELYQSAGQPREAELVAASLVLRGLADPQTDALAVRPASPPRLVQALDETVMLRVRHPGEDALLGDLFDTLAGEGVIDPLMMSELELGPQTKLAAQAASSAFAPVLRYVTTLLGVPEAPPVHVRADMEWDARLADTRPACLVVGPNLVASEDRIELAFRFGRALSFHRPGRRSAASRPGRLLRPHLLDVLALAGRPVASGSVVERRRRLEALRPAAVARLRDIGRALLDDRRVVDLSAWVRALGRTSQRVGLLVCGDLLRVGAAVAIEEGPDALGDLLDFALSPEAAAVRDQLVGTATAPE